MPVPVVSWTCVALVSCFSLPASALTPADQRQTPLSEITAYAAEARTQAPLTDAQQARLAEARVLFEEDRLVESAQILDELRDGPAGRSFEVNLLLARVNQGFQFYEEAREAALRALAARPDDVRANVLAGRLYLLDGQPEQAMPHLRAATLADDAQAGLAEATRAWQLLAETLGQLGYARAANAAWRNFDISIWETFPEHRNYEPIAGFLFRHPQGGFEFRLALLRELDARDEIVALLDEALQRRPDDADLRRQRIEALSAAGRTDEAFEQARARVDAGRDVATLLPVAVRSGLEAGLIDGWIDDLVGDLAAPERRGPARALLRELNRRGAATEATRLAAALVEADASDVGASVGLFSARVAGGDPLGGLRILTRMFRADPTLAVAERYLAEVRRPREAVRRFPIEDLRAVEPDDYATGFVVGLLLRAQGDQEAARRQFAEVHQASPDFVPARLEQVADLLDRYRWEDALALADELVAAHPKMAQAWYLRARALAGLDRNDHARVALRQAIACDPDEPAYPLAVGDLCRRIGDYRCAQRYYGESFQLAASDAAFEGAIEAYLRAGQRDLAETEAAKLDHDGISADTRRRVRAMIRYLDQPFSEVHLKELAAQLDEVPDDVLTIRMYAAGLFATGRSEPALEWIEYAHSLDPDDYELTLELARMYRMRARFGEAAATLAPIAERYPNRIDVLEDYSTDLLASFQVDAGLDVLARLVPLEDEEDAERRQRQLLVVCLEFNAFERAAAVLADIKEMMAAREEDATQVELDYLVAVGRDGDEYALAREWWQQQPDDRRRRERLFNAAVRMEDYETIAGLVQRWIDAGDNAAGWTDLLISVRIAEKNYEAAREAAEAFNGNFREQILRRIWLGQIAASAGDLPLATREFEALLDERAIPREQKAVAWNQWINALTVAGAYDDALDVCRRWQETDPDLAPLIRNARLGVLQSAGRDREQLPLLEEMYAAGSGQAGINNDLGYTWADQGLHLDEAAAMVRYALALDPLNSAYLDSYGWVAYKQGDFETAREALRRAVSLRSGRDATLHDHLGDAYWRLHEIDAAIAAWRCAARILDDTQEPSPRDLRLRQAVRGKLNAASSGGQPSVAATGEGVTP